MKYNVFDTEAEAITAQASDYTAWKAAVEAGHTCTCPECCCGKYWTTTTAWAAPFPRATDSKWVYPVCAEGSQEHTQEDFSETWLESGE